MHSSSATLSRLGLAILLLTICVGPFFQGYFFATPTLAAMTATAGAFSLWALGRRKQRRALNLPGDWTGTLLLALMTWCVLATAWAVYVRDHLTLVMRVAMAFAAFSLVREESSETVRRAIVWLLTFTAVVVSILGLLEYSGFFMEHVTLGNLLQIEPQRDRLYTVFQYPNSAATFFLAVLLLQHTQLIVSQSHTHKLALGVSSVVIALAFTLTLSRGATLIAPASVVLLWVGLSARQVLTSVLYLVVATGLPVALAIRPITQAAAVDAWPTVLLWTLLAALVGAVTTEGLQTLLRQTSRVQTIVGVVFVALLLVGGVFAIPRVLNQMPNVFARIAQMSVEDFTTNGRLEFLRDAGVLAIRRPWGYGGGGWLRTYTQVQRYNYVARDPHSHYALTLVEAGVPGLALLMGSIVVGAFYAYRVRRKDPVRWAMGVAALTLAAHAAIDVDLSYYALWLLFWALLGAAQPDPQYRTLRQESRFVFPTAVTLAAVVMAFSVIWFLAARAYNSAQVALLVGDNTTAIMSGNRAIQLDPLNSQYRSFIPTSENINRALDLDPYNEELWRFVSIFLEEQGDTDAALSAAQRALQLRPMSVSHYERVADLLIYMMTTALEEGRMSDAATAASKIIELGEEMEKKGKATLARQKLVFPAYQPLTWTPRLNLAVGQAYLVAGEPAAAESRLSAALANRETAADAALWLHALYARSGNNEKLAALEPKPSAEALHSDLYSALLAVP